MQKVLNYMRGNVRVEVICPYTERFVNICAQNDIEFWDFQRLSKTEICVTIRARAYKCLEGISKTAGFEVSLLQAAGVPFFLKRIKKRYALIAAMIICVLAAWGMSLFIWEIDVTGNVEVDERAILKALEDVSIGIGTFGPSVVSESVANDILLELPELSWIAINVSGSHAQVLVRERIPVPEIIDENAATMVYAVKSGLISDMHVLEGRGLVAKGDTVLAGDVLVSGAMESLSSGTRYVHASAEIYARTWYELSARMPLSYYQKVYSGQENTKNTLKIVKKNVNLQFNSGISWSNYDKIKKESILQLPTGNILPATIVREVYSEYEKIESVLKEDVAVEILSNCLLNDLKEKIVNENSIGEIVSTRFESSVENGIITVTLSAECFEQIAAVRSITDEEMHLAG